MTHIKKNMLLCKNGIFFRYSFNFLLCTCVVLVFSACGSDLHKVTSSVYQKIDISRMSNVQIKALVEKYGKYYIANPKNKKIGLTYASLLKRVGKQNQALSVMQKIVIYHPEDTEVLSAYGKALAAAGNFDKALKILERAQKPDYPDWKILSAKGAILDQLGKSSEARKYYHKAMNIKPNQPALLSNLGMSYLLTGNLKKAENYLRKASSLKISDSRIRQNLALIIALQGRFKEAEVIIKQELKPEEAKENIKHLYNILTQKNSWNELKIEELRKSSNS